MEAQSWLFLVHWHLEAILLDSGLNAVPRPKTIGARETIALPYISFKHHPLRHCRVKHCTLYMNCIIQCSAVISTDNGLCFVRAVRRCSARLAATRRIGGPGLGQIVDWLGFVIYHCAGPLSVPPGTSGKIIDISRKIASENGENCGRNRGS